MLEAVAEAYPLIYHVAERQALKQPIPAVGLSGLESRGNDTRS